MQVMLLLTSPPEPTAHTVNLKREPGVKSSTVIVFVVLDSDSEWPTRRYLITDFAGIHVNVRDWLVELINSHCPSIRGAG